MKKTLICGALTAMLAGLTACSSDNNDSPEIPKEPAKAAGYMTIGLRNAPGLTRANGDDYETGDESDLNITPANTRFYFFTSDDKPYTMIFDGNANGEVSASGSQPTNMVRPTEISPATTNYGPSAMGQAVLVLGSAAGGYKGSIPSKVIAISSSDPDFNFTQFANVKLEDLKGMTTNASANLLSSSTWVDNGKIVSESRISTDNISTTPEGAKANPVIVYLERNKARVRVNPGQPLTPKFATAKVGGEPLSIKMGDNSVKYAYIVPQGFLLEATAPESYVIKKLSPGLYPDLLGDASKWNEPGRSFWATTPSEASNTPFSFDDFSTNPQDCAENIPISQKYEPNDAKTSATKLIVGYKLFLTDTPTAPSDLSTPSQLLEWGGIYYTPENMIKFVAEQGYENVYMVRGDIQKGTNDYDVFFYTSSSPVDNANVPRLDPIAGDEGNRIAINPARYWNGAGYYILNIVHYPTADGSIALYGVVRNHIYDYTFTDFVGLGTPYVTGEVLPENPTSSESYVAAELNVLNWRVMSNKTHLE